MFLHNWYYFFLSHLYFLLKYNGWLCANHAYITLKILKKNKNNPLKNYARPLWNFKIF